MWDKADATRAQLVDTCRPPIHDADDRTIAFVAIEALNLWAAFVRAVYLSCVHNARRESGGRVSVSVTGLHNNVAAIAFSRNIVKVTRRGEPIWHERVPCRSCWVRSERRTSHKYRRRFHINHLK